MNGAFKVGDRIRLKPRRRIVPRGKDHYPGRKGVIVDLMGDGTALIRFTGPQGTRRGGKSVEELSKFERDDS